MYLILSHTEAETRNLEEAKKLDIKGGSIYLWAMIVGDELTALDVEDGDGLTGQEALECVGELPVGFIKNWN
jgi:hypothetical protein